MANAIAKSPKTKNGFSRFILDALQLPTKIAGGICIAIAMHGNLRSLGMELTDLIGAYVTIDTTTDGTITQNPTAASINGWFNSSMPAAPLSHVIYSDTSHEAWEVLKMQYGQHTTGMPYENEF
ncbi:hypothetical protein SADUNF_Sadunf06G0189300 [Salix dunnii]|uniref:Uncharacterized protein n=1 Tax=Salix dunnii TaxID=1413687 RepID=A0A835KA43_9ROSI|nr:hypothetical protein SADUNF_Sadunf06G0189300 [Salix dunnii]